MSCARATIGFENSNAAVADKMVNGPQADHSTRTRIDDFCLLEDIHPAPLNWMLLSNKMPERFLLFKKKTAVHKTLERF